MLLMLSARHFLWVPEAWPGRRSETRLRQRGSRNKRQKEEAAERAAADGAPVKGACVAVQCSAANGWCSAVQSGSAPMLSVVCCFVSGEPVRRPAIQAAEGCGVQQQQQQQQRPGGQAAEDSDMRAAGWSVGRGCGCAMAENLGAGGRSSRWCRQAGLDVRLCRTTTRDGYDAACDQQQRNVYGSEQLWNNGVRTDVQNRSLRSRVPNLLCGGELPEQPLVTWAPVKVRQGSWAQVKSTVAYPIRMYTL